MKKNSTKEKKYKKKANIKERTTFMSRYVNIIN